MEIGEAVKVSILNDLKFKDRCPFCHEKKVGHREELKRSNLEAKPESKPNDLGCAKIEKSCDYPYTTASHHLIPVRQAYSRLRRLVRMGNSVGYDINNSNNGAPLPTYKPDTKDWNYKNLDPTRKQTLSNGVMNATGKQWHVGHHRFDQTLEREGADAKSGNEVTHEVSYDSAVLRMLLGVCDKAGKALCEGKNPEDSFKRRMDKVSNEIANHLEKFGGRNPMSCRPFFVSMRAVAYAEARAAKRHGR